MWIFLKLTRGKIMQSKLKITFVALASVLFLSGCFSTLRADLYGDPLNYNTPEEWMARSYLKAKYLNNVPTHWYITGIPGSVYTDKKIAVNTMVRAYKKDFDEFFTPCYIAARKQEKCGIMHY
jgi:hypothetical protein